MSLKRLLFLVKVEGLSGWPYLKPGEKYLATSLSKPKKGDFVVFRDEKENRFLVKKVLGKENKGYLVASFGLVAAGLIEGKIIGL